MNNIESLLLAISNLLFYPVLIGLLAFVVHQCLQIGQLLARTRQRVSGKKIWVDQFKNTADNVNEKSDHLSSDLMIVLRQWELSKFKSLQLNRLVVKAAPSLGLMGTLIPMGTAMASLSEGNMMLMSANMVTAFTTTVVGMACGLSAFLVVHVKSQWLQNDLLDCEIYCEQMVKKSTQYADEKEARRA